MTIIIFCVLYIQFLFLLLPALLLRKVSNVSFEGNLFCLSGFEFHFFFFEMEILSHIFMFFVVVLVFSFRFLACPFSYLSTSRNYVVASNLTLACL